MLRHGEELTAYFQLSLCDHPFIQDLNQSLYWSKSLMVYLIYFVKLGNIVKYCI
ncbi:uncharacterized protein M6B38_166965 [Iris pallida]|uniref:Uncharacterized protein n=1 Tax=Iris pallida TaxID=29817 RepID=A0AAX6EX82_IRIPA|nr:uncharacterized protein M6B38_166965 [Iris pallida]